LRTALYVVDAKHTIKNLSNPAADLTLYAELVRDNGKLEESMFYATFTGPALYTDAEKFQKIEFTDIEKNKAKIPGPHAERQSNLGCHGAALFCFCLDPIE